MDSYSYECQYDKQSYVLRNVCDDEFTTALMSDVTIHQHPRACQPEMKFVKLTVYRECSVIKGTLLSHLLQICSSVISGNRN